MATRLFAKHGAFTIDADQVGHRVLEYPETKQKIRDTWGDRVFDEMGNVDRRCLAEIVFQDDSKQLERLERITHPLIESRLRQMLKEVPKSYPAVVLDAPIMIKAGWDRFCDKIVFVDCPRAERWQRARQRGWTEAMFASRENAQVSVEIKRSKATDFVDNSGTEVAFRQQIKQLWVSWQLPLTTMSDD